MNKFRPRPGGTVPHRTEGTIMCLTSHYCFVNEIAVPSKCHLSFLRGTWKPVLLCMPVGSDINESQKAGTQATAPTLPEPAFLAGVPAGQKASVAGPARRQGLQSRAQSRPLRLPAGHRWSAGRTAGFAASR